MTPLGLKPKGNITIGSIHFGVGAPPMLEPILGGDWDVHRGYDLDFDPWPDGQGHLDSRVGVQALPVSRKDAKHVESPHIGKLIGLSTSKRRFLAWGSISYFWLEFLNICTCIYLYTVICSTAYFTSPTMKGRSR